MQGRITKAATFVAILLLFFLIRLPLLTEPGIWFGWHGDAGIIGIMAKRIVDGRDFDFFFLGQNWIGPLTSLFAAAIGLVRKLMALQPPIGPVALRLAAFLMVSLGIAFFWLALKKRNSAAATLTAIFLGIGPPLLFPSSSTAFGAEMIWFMGGLLTWFGASDLRGRRHALIFGLLCGLTLWMNQGAIFFVMGVAYALIRESEWWQSTRPRLRIRDRLTFRGLPRRVRTLFLALQFILIADLVYLLVRDLVGATTPIPGFFWPYGEPLALFIGTHALATVARRESWFSEPQRRALTGYLVWMGTGFLLGYGPVLLGRIFDWYPRLYTFGSRASYPLEVLASLVNLLDSGIGVLYGFTVTAILALALAAMVRLRGGWPVDRATMIILVAAIANLGHWLFVYHSADKWHYLSAAIPGAWLLAAIGVADLKNRRPWLAAAAAIAFLISLVAGARQQISRTMGEADPRPVIAALEREGCVVCYAEYWTAYKYRFLTNEAFHFIPYQSQDRTPEDSTRYRRLPGKRCLLLPNGKLSPLPPGSQ